MPPVSAARSLATRLWRRVRRTRAPCAIARDGVATIGDLDPRSRPPDQPIAFRCNLCGARAAAPLAALTRESPSCPRCGSTVRFHAIAHLVVREMPGESQPLFALSPRRGRYDFVIASDVFEHVAPPVSRAFDNALALLKPGGAFVMTVPFGLDADTVEHFPDLHDWTLSEDRGGWTPVNRTADGRAQTYTDLVSHGGPGTTLEMRLFSRDVPLREFARAGFASVRVADEPYLPFGILWPEPWSVPIVARAPVR